MEDSAVAAWRLPEQSGRTMSGPARQDRNDTPVVQSVAARLHVEWLAGLDSVESHRDQWIGLESKVDDRTVYVTYDYVSAWYRAYTSTKYADFGTPVIGYVWDQSTLRGVAPLIAFKSTLARIPVHYLTFAGYNVQAGEVLALDGGADVYEALLGSLADRSGWDVLVLTNMTPGSEQARAAQETAGRLGLGCEVMDDHSYAVADLRDGYETYARLRGSNFRKQARRHANKVAEAGPHAIDRLPRLPDPGVVRSYLDRMFAIADAGWRARERGLAEERSHHPFYRTLVERFATRGMVDLAILSVSGRDAAFSLALLEHGTYFHLMVAHNAEMASLSPGSFLLQEVFRVLPALGVHHVVSHGDYDYKRRWASTTVHPKQILVFARTARARLSRFSKFRLPRAWPRLRVVAGSPPGGGAVAGSAQPDNGTDEGRAPDTQP